MHTRYITWNMNTVLLCVVLSSSLVSLIDSSISSWWRHQMETFSALLALCAGNSPVTGTVMLHEYFTDTRTITWYFQLLYLYLLEKCSSHREIGLLNIPSSQDWVACGWIPKHYHSYSWGSLCLFNNLWVNTMTNVQIKFFCSLKFYKSRVKLGLWEENLSWNIWLHSDTKIF